MTDDGGAPPPVLTRHAATPAAAAAGRPARVPPPLVAGRWWRRRGGGGIGGRGDGEGQVQGEDCGAPLVRAAAVGPRSVPADRHAGRPAAEDRRPALPVPPRRRQVHGRRSLLRRC